jgi:hypothetical protein
MAIRTTWITSLRSAEAKQGQPIAFIELAWRRYTKHSRNKSGEIEGSLLHLRDTYKSCRFVGALLAGEYSEGGLRQLLSHQIAVLHVPFEKIAATFRTKGVDLSYPEHASDATKRQVISRWEALSERQLEGIKHALHIAINEDLQKFLDALEAAISRAIDSVRILSPYGEEIFCRSVAEGIELLKRYEPFISDRLEHCKYEVDVRFKNGSKVEGIFMMKEEALEFLGLFA